MATSVSLETDFVTLQSIESESAGTSVVIVTVDSTLTRISVSLSGTGANLIVKDSSGSSVVTSKANRELFSSDSIQIFTFDVASSAYTVEASATSEYTLRIGGISALKFDFGFSRKHPSSITDTYFRPLAGEKTILSVFVSDLEQIKNLKHVVIVPIVVSGGFKEFEVTLKRADKSFYSTEPFDAPEAMFRVKVVGVDPKDNVIDRLISTGIESTTGSE